MTRETRPTHLDLFSGIGGFSLAFEAEGFRTIGFAEIDPYASAVLRKHWPGVVNYGDIRTVPAIRCDVITGGFPCQPFSSAGKRRGAADDRHLWPAMRDVIDRCRPAWVLCENVAGIINMELDNCIVDLENLGYAVQPIVVPACAVDARHRRDRIWILAHSDIGGRGSEQREQQSERPEIIDGNSTDASNSESPRCQGSDTAGNSCADRQPGELRHAVGHTKRERGESARGREVEREILCQVERKESADSAGRSGEDVRHSKSKRERKSPDKAHAVSNGRKARHVSPGPSRWPPEPRLGRVADGIPNRSHRLKCLGNSIVPQVAQEIARCIYQCLT